MRILIVEDDRSLARGMEASMAAAGFIPDLAQSGEEAMKAAMHEAYQLIILDLGLPDIDGLDVLAALRQQKIQTPVLILTARGAIDDRIGGLDSGADDYLPKPFHPRELESRARALIRRSVGTADPIVRVGRLSLDRSTRIVAMDDIIVELRRRELAVLEALMDRPGKMISRKCLIDAVFNVADSVAPNALDVHVGRLRRKLEPKGPLIRTVRGLGYILEAD